MRILIVDDEPLVAQTLTLIFRRNGFDAVSAYNADDALALSRANPPDLVLCDIQMPVRDGISLMEDLNRELPGCPILVLTGFYSGLTRVQAFVATLNQPVTIVTKPVQPADLLQRAGALLAAA